VVNDTVREIRVAGYPGEPQGVSQEGITIGLPGAGVGARDDGDTGGARLIGVNLDDAGAARLEHKNEFERLSEEINVFDLWEGSVSKQHVADEMVEWIYGLSDWQHMVTLTYRWEIGYYRAMAMFRALVKRLCVRECSKDFHKRFGESYFGYVMGIEYQLRDVLHFHMIVDSWLDYSYLHKLWNKWAGFVWIEQIKSRQAVCRYISKYVLKGGDIYQYLPRRKYEKFRQVN